MKSLANFIAQSASFNTDSTFTVFKGGITELQAPAFPSFVQLALMTYLELTHEEANDLVELQIRISHEQVGEIVPPIRQPLNVKIMRPDRPIYVSSVAQLNLIFPAPGKMTFETAINKISLPLLYVYGNLVPS